MNVKSLLSAEFSCVFQLKEKLTAIVFIVIASPCLGFSLAYSIWSIISNIFRIL